MKLKLLKPTMEYASQVMKFKEELESKHEWFNGCAGLEEVDTFGEWIQFDTRFKQKGYAPADIYLCIRELDNKLIGIVEYRHPLSEFLKNYGGHIGYSILPSERNKGYGSEMLRLLLPLCRASGEKQLIIACDKENITSKKVIIHNGGKLYREFIDEFDIEGPSITQQYIIEL